MKGILFKPDMHKAIREGRKTVTRRVIKPQPPVASLPVDLVGEFSVLGKDYRARYQVGEVVYIKEAWYADNNDKGELYYRADWAEDQVDYVVPKWKSPLFMPAWAARDFIQITGVRAERLQEISPGELCTTELEREGIPYKNRFGIDFTTRLERYVLLEDFKKLWDSINKEHPWASNPWVWRYEFKRVERPT